jgi:hypothetical protein
MEKKNTINYLDSENKIVIITAIGIARITPLIPIVIPHNTMHKKIITGLTQRFCLNNSGIRILFSNH